MSELSIDDVKRARGKGKYCLSKLSIMSRLVNKIAIVTGSFSGIGRAIALKFSREGAVVVCADIRETARTEVLTETEIPTHDLITQNGGTAEFLRVDASKAEEVERLVAHTALKYGRLYNDGG
ncbi:hypothetical protein BDV33DRAFT_176760 [Aspergillus novoparasiticus]|uniref:NAD(P)-binding protein n=1 Tax=Aspergillus novoparasiticus TaxID=986946 RepID=A0A5N6EJH9_9EURO|nr:hypothetical protein BDV33DRAFT_176760 [Aspergillus novoparasiticus]